MSLMGVANLLHRVEDSCLPRIIAYASGVSNASESADLQKQLRC